MHDEDTLLSIQKCCGVVVMQCVGVFVKETRYKCQFRSYLRAIRKWAMREIDGLNQRNVSSKLVSWCSWRCLEWDGLISVKWIDQVDETDSNEQWRGKHKNEWRNRNELDDVIIEVARTTLLLRGLAICINVAKFQRCFDFSTIFHFSHVVLR